MSFPYFSPRTAVSLKGGRLKEALYSKSEPQVAWEGGEFSPIPGEGESPLLQLLLPFDYADLLVVAGGAFVKSADEFSDCFSGMHIFASTRETPRWIDALLKDAHV